MAAATEAETAEAAAEAFVIEDILFSNTEELFFLSGNRLFLLLILIELSLGLVEDGGIVFTSEKFKTSLEDS